MELECVDKSLSEKYRQLMEHANTLYEKGELYQDREVLFEAWKLLPEDKYIFDESYWIVAFILDLSMKLDDMKTADEWVDKIFKCDLERIDDGDREMWAGKVAYESGKVEEARKYFEIAYKKSEGRCFVEEGNEKYLSVLTRV